MPCFMALHFFCSNGITPFDDFCLKAFEFLCHSIVWSVLHAKAFIGLLRVLSFNFELSVSNIEVSRAFAGFNKDPLSIALAHIKEIPKTFFWCKCSSRGGEKAFPQI